MQYANAIPARKFAAEPLLEGLLKGVYSVMLAKSGIALPLCLCILLLAGCGYNGKTSNSSTNTAAQPATATAPITPAATATATPRITPGTSSTGVSVRSSASTYHPNETIVITITNATTQPISFADHQTNCSIVLLQHRDGTSWKSVALCKLMTLTRFLSLAAGHSSTISLKASDTWQKGDYRAAFTYSMGSLETAGTRRPATISYSPIFQVN